MENNNYMEGYNNGTRAAADAIFKDLIEKALGKGLTREEIINVARKYGLDVNATASSVGDIDAYKKYMSKKTTEKHDVFAIMYQRSPKPGDWVAEIFYLENNSTKLLATNAYASYYDAMFFIDSYLETHKDEIKEVHKRQFTSLKEYTIFVSELIRSVSSNEEDTEDNQEDEDTFEYYTKKVVEQLSEEDNISKFLSILSENEEASKLLIQAVDKIIIDKIWNILM